MKDIYDFLIEKDISADTKKQIVAIAEDYTQDFFTKGLPEDIFVDMGFQRAICVKIKAEIIAFVVFTCLDGSLHPTLMATKRNFSGKGYGKILMNKLIEYAEKHGLNSIELYTFSPQSRPKYAATVGFYKSMGFEIDREHKDLWEKGTTTLKMRKS